MTTARRFPPIAHAVFLVGALAVVTVLVALEPGWLTRLDASIVQRTFDATAGHPERERFWLRDATWQGPEVTRVGIALAALALAVTGERRRPVWLLAVVAAEAVIAPASKLLLDRPRPVWEDPITTLASASYPSGHAAAAGMLTGIVFVGTGSHLLRTLAAVWALLTMADRLFLGVHYPTDVVGGLLLGMVIVAIADTVSPFRAVRYLSGPVRHPADP